VLEEIIERKMQRHYGELQVSVLIVISVFLTSCGSSPNKSEQIAVGKRVYEQQCTTCHGLNGQGQFPDAPYKPDKSGRIGAPPHDSTGHTWHHPDAALLGIIKNGLVIEGFLPMPGFGDKLTDNEIQAVLVYLYQNVVETRTTGSASYRKRTVHTTSTQVRG
jgi:mono/diheme cytochrome c family protein